MTFGASFFFKFKQRKKKVFVQVIISFFGWDEALDEEIWFKKRRIEFY